MDKCPNTQNGFHQWVIVRRVNTNDAEGPVTFIFRRCKKCAADAMDIKRPPQHRKKGKHRG